MTASPIASVRVFDPRCRCRLATFAALPTPSMIEPIIMLTDHPLLAPHRQVRRCHRSIHCWHGHAAHRSVLPRERISPMARNRHADCNARCPLSGTKRKTYPRSQLFRFGPQRGNRHDLKQAVRTLIKCEPLTAKGYSPVASPSR
jgi:hypothetical protein